ncbi:MAG: uroporphyrinogen-III C-methyltransferase [Clostridia bacterium]|nr:uroporphyrinogen-III C-methyltransferase [Clostridia bacterium]
MSNTGKVYLVGAGCGDYDLITLRGLKLLKQCDTVVYDSLIDNRLIDFVLPNTEKICVGKRAGHHSEKQENINKILVQKANEGKTVVRLKGGDPFVFGRGGEEIQALQENNIEYSVVPGISSSVAVPELAGIPVTHRELSRSFHIITGHTSENLLPKDMKIYAELSGTLVFLMGLRNLKHISEMLIKYDKNENTPVAVISDGASKNQKIIRGNLNNIADKVEKSKLQPPAVIVVGDVATFDFSDTVKLPLKDTSVTVTGTKNFVEKLSLQLEKLGAEVQKANYLNVIEYTENKIFDNALMNIQKYSVIVLTSINGAEIFFNRLIRLNIDIRKLCNVKFAVIGSGTADVLKKHGIIADIVPDIYTSQALGNELVKKSSDNENILILRAEQGSPELTQILDNAKINYNDIKIYDVVGDSKANETTEINTDFITFASSSGVKAFFENNYKISSKTKIICIGNATANTLKSYEISDYLISETQNVQGITDTILQEVQNEQIQTTESE